MKKLGIFALGIVFLAVTLAAEDDILNLGKIHFPRPFVHAQKNYDKGIYRVFISKKEDNTYFKVFNTKNEFLFEDLAIIKPYQGKSKNFKYRIKKGILKGNEYFRLQVTTPDNIYLGFFLLQRPEGAVSKPEPPKPDSEGEKKTG